MIPATDRFWNSVYCDPNTGCFLWTKGNNGNGYGYISVSRNGRWGMMLAHRFAYENFVGPTNGMMVLHRCDTPACCNPDHLFLGTKGDNTRDMVAKGRHARSNAKVSAEQYAEIRSLVRSGVSQRSAAKTYGLSPARLCQIMKQA